MKYINGKYYGLFTEVNMVENPTDLQIFNCVDTGMQYRFFEGKWYKQPVYWVDRDNVGGGGGGGSDLPDVTSADNGDVLTVVNGAWDKAEPSGGSDLPEVTSADNGNVLGVVGGEWGKTNPGYTITRQQFTIFENEAVTRNASDNYINYSFDGLTRESDLPDLPGYSNVCWIRLPDEFVPGAIDGKVRAVFQMNSSPMPSDVEADCFYDRGGGLEEGDRVDVYLQAVYSEPEKSSVYINTNVVGGGFDAGARYLDDSTIPALDDPDDYGWYFSVHRTGVIMLADHRWDPEYDATLPETASITVYLEMADVEFDPDYKEAIVNVSGQTPTPVLYFFSDSDTPNWVLINFDPDKADPDTFVNGAAIPAIIVPEMFYLANDPSVEGYYVFSSPISGSLSVSFDLVDGGYVPNSVEIKGTALVFIADPSDNDSLVALRLESYHAECYREQDPDTGEYGEWGEWFVSRESITDLTELTTSEYTPLMPDGDDSGDDDNPINVN